MSKLPIPPVQWPNFVFTVALVRTLPPLAGKDDLADAMPTEGSSTPTPTLVVSHASTLAPAEAPAPPLASAAADSAAWYSAKDLQRILKIILEARALACQSKILCKRPLKARAPDLYRGKTHMECYNFCKQCKDHFATSSTTGLNHISFAATFLKDKPLFHWQQYQRKLADKTDVFITWEKFKVFFCCSLGESIAFVDSIWSTIQKDSQYHLEEILDWAAYLEPLQTIFKSLTLLQP